VLAVQLLKLANSAHYGGRSPVGTIDDAIFRVGTAQVRALALASMFNDSFPVSAGLDRQTFWRESQTCGGLAQWMASGIGSDSQQAWLTGVMVRLGELLIGMKVPSSVMEFEREPRYPGARWEREASLMGFTEGQVSAELARAWNFPEEMIQALNAAANPMAAQPFSRLGAVLHVAELMAATPDPSPQSVDDLPANVLAALEVDAAWMHSRLPQAQRFVQASRLH
jgi:HD-like signal output (HDOD) protein